MLPSSSGGMSEESASEDEDRPPLNLHINQHSNLYKYNNQFTVGKHKAYKKGQAAAAAQRNSHTSDDGGEEDNDRPDTPIQVAWIAL